jgi:TonB family protein
MRHSLGSKIGQSGNELVLSVFFSFFLHAALVALALFIIYAVNPKIYVPPFYDVKLVGLPGPSLPASAPAAAAAAVSSPPKPEAAPSRELKQLTKKAPEQHAKVSPKKEAMPEFSSRKPKSVPQTSAKTVTKLVEPAAPAAPAGAHTSPVGKPGGVTGGVAGGVPGGKPGGKPGGRAEDVAVSSSSADFKFPPYLALVRDKIEQNWNPPPGAVAAKAKVEFTVLRSGIVGDARLLTSSGNFYFDQAAVRAIKMSSPLPPMPEGFYKDYAVFTVDLLENE